MRRFMLLLPMLFACNKTETPPADTMAAMAATAAVMALTEADVAGTWKGATMPEGSDSVVSKWTQVCAAGSCKGVMDGMKDTMMSTYTIVADSVIGTSPAMKDPMSKKMVTDHWSLHLRDGKVVGTGMNRLADKPDSVVFRYHFEGSRAP